VEVALSFELLELSTLAVTRYYHCNSTSSTIHFNKEIPADTWYLLFYLVPRPIDSEVTFLVFEYSHHLSNPEL